MKKYLHNRKTGEVPCANCNTICLKPQSEITRNLKLNRRFFCSRRCSVILANRERDPSTRINTYDISQHSVNRRDELSPFRCYLRSCKARFKIVEITLQDLKYQWEKQNGICPYAKVKMNLRNYSKKPKNLLYRASIDRIDNSKDYTKDNIEFICLPINYLKSTFTKEQVLEFLNNFKSSDFSEVRTISSSN